MRVAPTACLKLFDNTVGLENFTTEKVHEYVFSTIVDSFHELNIHDWVVEQRHNLARTTNTVATQCCQQQ